MLPGLRIGKLTIQSFDMIGDMTILRWMVPGLRIGKITILRCDVFGDLTILTWMVPGLMRRSRWPHSWRRRGRSTAVGCSGCSTTCARQGLGLSPVHISAQLRRFHH